MIYQIDLTLCFNSNDFQSPVLYYSSTIEPPEMEPVSGSTQHYFYCWDLRCSRLFFRTCLNEQNRVVACNSRRIDVIRSTRDSGTCVQYPYTYLCPAYFRGGTVLPLEVGQDVRVLPVVVPVLYAIHRKEFGVKLAVCLFKLQVPGSLVIIKIDAQKYVNLQNESNNCQQLHENELQKVMEFVKIVKNQGTTLLSRQL